MRKLYFVAALAAPFMLSGCNSGGGVPGSQSVIQKVATDVQTFEQKAAPVAADACSTFRKAEANPAVQAALPVGEALAGAAVGAATGGIGAGAPALAVNVIKSFGDDYCADGPPPGDATTEVQQAQWLAGVTTQLLGAAGVKL